MSSSSSLIGFGILNSNFDVPNKKEKHIIVDQLKKHNNNISKTMTLQTLNEISTKANLKIQERKIWRSSLPRKQQKNDGAIHFELESNVMSTGSIHAHPIFKVKNEFYVPEKSIRKELEKVIAQPKESREEVWIERKKLVIQKKEMERGKKTSFHLGLTEDLPTDAAIRSDSEDSMGESGSDTHLFLSPEDALHQLNGSTCFYNKDGVINNIFIYLIQAFPENAQDKKIRPQLEIVARFKLLEGEFVDKNKVEELLNELNKYIEVKSFNFKDLTRNLEPFLKLSGLPMQTAFVAQKIITHDQTLPQKDKNISDSAFVSVYKSGLENLREILSIKKAQIEGYEDVLLHKDELFSTKFKLELRGKELTSPIESDFLEGFQHLNTEDWKIYGKAKMAYELESYQVDTNQIKKISKKTKRNLIKAERKIESYKINHSSICKLVFYELLECATDGHIEQFMFGPNPVDKNDMIILSVDEGKWGPIGQARPHVEGQVTANLRVFLLNHPDCYKPVPAEFREFLIKKREKDTQELEERVGKERRLGHNYSLKKIKMKELDLVWTKSELKKMAEEFREYSDLRKKLKDMNYSWEESELIMLSKQYEIDYQPIHLDPSLTEEEKRKQQWKAITNRDVFRLELASLMDDKIAELRGKSFRKQSEASLDHEIFREKRMVDCILNNPNASIYDAFEAGYPGLKTFMKVLRRTEIDPGSSLSYYRPKGMDMAPRSLDQFLEEIKKRGKSIATKQEIKQMTKDLKQLKLEMGGYKLSEAYFRITQEGE